MNFFFLFQKVKIGNDFIHEDDLIAREMKTHREREGGRGRDGVTDIKFDEMCENKMKEMRNLHLL